MLRQKAPRSAFSYRKALSIAAKMTDLCPASAPFFGFMGAAVALIFASACRLLRIDRRPANPCRLPLALPLP